MRQEKGLEALSKDHIGKVTVATLSKLLLDDLKDCKCSIFGVTKNEKPVLLTTLELMTESLYYDKFDQRIDFTVAGEILENRDVPLTYKVQGNKYYFYGRCSTIARVCGVDLYLSPSYTEKIGDIARQRFSISVKKILKTL